MIFDVCIYEESHTYLKQLVETIFDAYDDKLIKREWLIGYVEKDENMVIVDIVLLLYRSEFLMNHTEEPGRA